MIEHARKNVPLPDGTTARFVRAQVHVRVDGQREFKLPRRSAGHSTFSCVTVNTVDYPQPYFSIEDDILRWTGEEFDLDPEDEVFLHYYCVEG